MSISENPMFGVMIGQQIGNNASAEAAEIRLTYELNSASNRANEATGALLEVAQNVFSLKQEYEAIIQSHIDLYVAIAGVRGVTRELLNELRRADPNNPLLEKKVRDAVFDGAFNEQAKRQDGKSWRERQKESQQYRDETYGAPNANKGGPEKDQITPNIEVRKAAGVPEGHVTDRERFLALTEKLAVALTAANPNDSILQDTLLTTTLIKK